MMMMMMMMLMIDDDDDDDDVVVVFVAFDWLFVCWLVGWTSNKTRSLNWHKCHPMRNPCSSQNLIFGELYATYSSVFTSRPYFVATPETTLTAAGKKAFQVHCHLSKHATQCYTIDN
eukprot:3460918-Amphidinium_carterae.1